MKKPKKLKRIPADLVAYVRIEGEVIRDANDKMLIVSYAYGKIEIIDWYIALIDAQSKNYVVPHSREHLVGVKNQLLDAIEKIMDRPVPKPSDANIKIDYPKGYEG
jgi:hypothetical protein